MPNITTNHAITYTQRPCLGKISTSYMALKQWHKTRWNGDKEHKDGLNTNRNMAYSKCQTTIIFEIQTRDIRTPTKRTSINFSNIRQMKLSGNNSCSSDIVWVNLMSDEIPLAVGHDDQTDPFLKTNTLLLKIPIAINEI